MCQVMTTWTGSKESPCPEYIACNDLTRGDQFVACQAMGTWCEVDVITFVNGVNKHATLISEARRAQIEADVATIDGVKATYADDTSRGVVARIALARAQDALLAKKQK